MVGRFSLKTLVKSDKGKISLTSCKVYCLFAKKLSPSDKLLALKVVFVLLLFYALSTSI